MYRLYAVQAVYEREQDQKTHANNRWNKRKSLTDRFWRSFHLLLRKTKGSTVVNVKGHLSLNVQNNLRRLEHIS
jgi:hypothetical protein